MKINPNGYWENETAEGHCHDEGLAKALVDFLNKQPRDYPITFVVDIGCGDGYYTKYINDNGNDTLMCHGVDGNPNTIELAGLNTYIMDLSKPTTIHQYDWALCLEVGEHIPVQHEQTFLKNLNRANKYGIILSWAVRGQGGDGHVNCLDNWEVRERLHKLGYWQDVTATTKLRNECAIYPNPGYWFRDTLMVFRKDKHGTISS